jgi:hypothetical protein
VRWPIELSFDISLLVQDLDALSALAVIAGVIFVIFQLRQNAKLIEASDRQIDTANRQVEASIQQNRQQVILSVVDRFTNDAFNVKRKKVREIAKKYEANNWEGYLESADDYDVRGFIAHYESTGYLARIKIVDAKMMQEAMGFGIIYDWVALEPVVEYYRKAWKRAAYANFEWLKDAVKKGMERDGIDTSTGPSPTV